MKKNGAWILAFLFFALPQLVQARIPLSPPAWVNMALKFSVTLLGIAFVLLILLKFSKDLSKRGLKILTAILLVSSGILFLAAAYGWQKFNHQIEYQDQLCIQSCLRGENPNIKNPNERYCFAVCRL